MGLAPRYPELSAYYYSRMPTDRSNFEELPLAFCENMLTADSAALTELIRSYLNQLHVREPVAPGDAAAVKVRCGDP